jgi:hypothetical protein
MNTTWRLNVVVAALGEALTGAVLPGLIAEDVKNDWKSVFLFETK